MSKWTGLRSLLVHCLETSSSWLHTVVIKRALWRRNNVCFPFIDSSGETKEIIIIRVLFSGMFVDHTRSIEHGGKVAGGRLYESVYGCVTEEKRKSFFDNRRSNLPLGRRNLRHFPHLIDRFCFPVSSVWLITKERDGTTTRDTKTGEDSFSLSFFMHSRTLKERKESIK